jgi:hypothetical protein
MVSGSHGYGAREEWSWCWRVTLMVLENDGYGVRVIKHLPSLGVGKS